MLRMIGLTDTVSKCDCCGRSIKKAVALTDAEGCPDSSEVSFYGSQCAATALRVAGIKGFKKELTNTQILKMAQESTSAENARQKNLLLATNKAILCGGYYLLADHDVVKTGLDFEINRRNEAYPCFA